MKSVTSAAQTPSSCATTNFLWIVYRQTSVELPTCFVTELAFDDNDTHFLICLSYAFALLPNISSWCLKWGHLWLSGNKFVHILLAKQSSSFTKQNKHAYFSPTSKFSSFFFRVFSPELNLSRGKKKKKTLACVEPNVFMLTPTRLTNASADLSCPV